MQGGPEVWGLQCTRIQALPSCKHDGDAPTLLLDWQQRGDSPGLGTGGVMVSQVGRIRPVGERCVRRDRCEMNHQKIGITAQCGGRPGGKVQGAWRKGCGKAVWGVGGPGEGRGGFSGKRE